MKQTNAAQLEKSKKIMEELKELRGGSVLDFHKKIANDPAMLYAFQQQYLNCNKKDTVIPRKYRELIIFALGCARGVPTTINTHGRLAFENGATIEELGEVMRLVFFLCGATAVIPAAELFEKIDFDEGITG